MITIVSCSSCKSSNRAKIWLSEHHLEFKEVNLSTEEIDEKMLKKILSLTESGVEEIFRNRSQKFKKLRVNISGLGLQEWIKLVKKETELIKRPIVFDERKLCVGYKEDELRVFLSRETRRMELNLIVNEKIQS